MEYIHRMVCVNGHEYAGLKDERVVDNPDEPGAAVQAAEELAERVRMTAWHRPARCPVCSVSVFRVEYKSGLPVPSFVG